MNKKEIIDLLEQLNISKIVQETSLSALNVLFNTKESARKMSIGTSESLFVNPIIILWLDE